MIASDRDALKEDSTIAGEGLDAALRDAAEQGDMAAMEKLVARGADVNAMEEHGNAPLHCAATEGSVAAMKWLVEEGANVLAKDKDGDTVLNCAVLNGHMAATQWLVAHGADINAVTGMDSLHFTVRHGMGIIWQHCSVLLGRGQTSMQ
jgi:ankyrin repeat protein